MEAAPEDRKAVLARVRGRVQGVYFRGWMQAEARRRGVSGWVRNEADGSVAALIAGPAGDVEQMVAMLWQGPAAAEVVAVATEPAEAAHWPVGFEVVR